MIFLALILSAIFSYILYRKTNPDISRQRKSFLFLLRLVTLWIILSFLLIPIYKVTRVSFQKPKAIVMIDDSASMNIAQESMTKSEQITSLLANIKADLESNFDVKYENFASSLNGSDNSSDVIKSIEDLFVQGEDSSKEIYLLSDGHYVNNSFALLRDYPYKINTFRFANQQEELQPKFLNIRSNRTTFLNDPTPIEITSNIQGNKETTIEIYEGEKKLWSKDLENETGDIAKNLLHLKFETVGLHELTINLQDENEKYDTAKLVIKVNDNKNNITLLTDSPDWDAKSIKDALKLDNRFKYRFIVLKDRKMWEGNKEVQLEDVLRECQLLILNNDKRLLLNPEDSRLISSKINNGLSIFFIGDIVNGLDEFYPVRKTEIDRKYEAKVIPGLASKNYTTFSTYLENFKDLPPVKYKYFALKNSAQEIATMDNMERSPAITSHQLNQAKILHFGFEDFWRFSLRADNDAFNELIRNIIQWLSSKSGENFIVSTDKDGYYFGETVSFSAAILDEKGDFISQKKLRLELVDSNDQMVVSDFLLWKTDEYSYELDDLNAGLYHYKVTDIDTKQTKKGNFIVFNNSLEQSHTDFNNVALNEISRITGGKHNNSSDLPGIKDSLVREKISTNLYSEFKILYNNYFLLLVILSFSLELYFRRRWGLI